MRQHSLLYVYFSSYYTSNVYRRSRIRGMIALVFFNIYLLNHVHEFTYFTTTSSPSRFRPFSGKNFGAVCSGVVDVPFDERLPPPVPLASLVLGCARPVAE
jgi:hypothetical protein